MRPFLFRIAEAFYQNYKEDISHFTFVFPNRRAGLFFQKYLTEQIEKPIFSPQIVTVNELFYSASEKKVIDRIESLFRLYRIFRKVSKRDETFDTFINWGDMLLSDFSDVDKYKVEAVQLFNNVTELKEIDTVFDYLEPNQKEAIAQFWSHFIPDAKGKSEEDFISVWRVLLPLYQQFEEELTSENLATDAMIFREVAEKLDNQISIDVFDDKQYVFIGFNALNPCERALFNRLKNNGQADFYWDYEGEQLRDADNPSSLFYRRNIKNYPSKLSIASEVISLNEKYFELIAVPSLVGQAKESYQLLNELYPADKKDDSWIKTAVVLPDENMLMPLLYSLPKQIEKVNVTMGYPLKITPAAALVENIYALQRRKRVSGKKALFYHQTVMEILNHSYIQLFCKEEADRLIKRILRENLVFVEQGVFEKNELLSQIFTPVSDANVLLVYLNSILKKIYSFFDKTENEDKHIFEKDFLYEYYTVINRFTDVFQRASKDIELTIDTAIRIMRRVTAGLTIPFQGEPLEGLQIMGTLESRGLDFENLIITSFNDNIFPKKNHSNSFIPYNLRKAFDLPTYENKDAISSYNFYRLIQRAKKIYFLYDERTEGTNIGEVSRFVYQLQYHYGITPVVRSLSYEFSAAENTSIEIEKTPEILKKLDNFKSNSEEQWKFSASSINTYLNCPLKFYFSYVEKMKEKEEVEEDVEFNIFGTILHKVLQDIYTPFEGKLVNKSDLDEITANPHYIDKLIRNAFSLALFNKNDEPFELEGNNLLVGKLINKYALSVLNFDKTKTPFTYIYSEKDFVHTLPVANSDFSVSFKGIIDRVEEKDGVTSIIDYKSGADALDFKSIGDLFVYFDDKRPKNVFQTFYYSLFYLMDNKDAVVSPNIYYIKNIFKRDFSTQVTESKEPVVDFNALKDEFETKLRQTIGDIYNPELPFSQCGNAKICQYCSFNEICKVEVNDYN